MTPNITSGPALIGHEKRWAALARAFGNDQVPQTLLISGPPQLGKGTLARRYAQLLLCPQAVRSEPGADGDNDAEGNALPAPCGVCRVCHQIEIETFPDFMAMRPIVAAAKDERDWIAAPPALEGSIITVEMARKFGDEAMRKPLIGARKVMVMEQTERMSTEAQNALLKTFEEPVRGLCIVLLCGNPSELLPTVRSRAWHLPLGLASDAGIAAWLRREFDGAPPEFITQAVVAAAGRPGAAWREMRRLHRADDSEANSGAGKPGNAGANAAANAAAKPVRSGANAGGANGNGASGADAETPVPRFEQAACMVERIARSQPVGALGLSEEVLRLAREWWNEDHADEAARDAKKSDAKTLRSAIARFLDELSNAYRARWLSGVARASSGGRGQPSELDALAAGLDQIRKTRHYILRNANSSLALDVMFGHLIALQQESGADAKRARPRAEEAYRRTGG